MDGFLLNIRLLGIHLLLIIFTYSGSSAVVEGRVQMCTFFVIHCGKCCCLVGWLWWGVICFEAKGKLNEPLKDNTFIRHLQSQLLEMMVLSIINLFVYYQHDLWVGVLLKQLFLVHPPPHLNFLHKWRRSFIVVVSRFLENNLNAFHCQVNEFLKFFW